MVTQELARRIAQRSRPSASDVVHRDIKNSSPSIQQKIQGSLNRAMLIVDRNHPGTIEFQGEGVKFASKQYRLLRPLAESPASACTTMLYIIRSGATKSPWNCSTELPQVTAG
jgi:hypothetical protein